MPIYSADLAEVVIASVAEGGDTDTNAAVCGALLGAAHGREAVPLQWRNAVLTCHPVRADDVLRPRPMTYWPDECARTRRSIGFGRAGPARFSVRGQR